MAYKPKLKDLITERIKSGSFTYTDILSAMSMSGRCHDHVSKEGVALNDSQQVRAIDIPDGDKRVITACLLDAADGSQIWGCYLTSESEAGNVTSRYLGYTNK